MDNLIHEECGVFGVFSSKNEYVAKTVYYGLFALQHRGQEAAGIVVCDDGVFSAYKDSGLVNDIFDAERLGKLGSGNMALGHVRYGTTGDDKRENAQPIVVNHSKGNMAIAHNGNLVNAYKLRSELESEGCIFHSSSDTEVIAYILTKARLKSKTIEEAVVKACDVLEGAYSLIIMSPTKMIAARDRWGFRPLCYGIRDDGSYIIASESCALDSVGAKKIRDIEPGEVLVFTRDGIKSHKDHCGIAPKKFCVFEYFYFARPDSIIDNCSVHEARIKAGEFLAELYKIDADLVMGVPDSGLDAALGYSKKSGIPYEIGMIKNKYIGRTFIAPEQSQREDDVRIKLNVIGRVIQGKRVIVIDDSIVRGTTSARIVNLIREGGAKEVHFLSSAPKFLNPCYYGTDIDSRDNLIAAHHNEAEIAEIIGADSVGYLSVEKTKLITGTDGSDLCMACFDGIYPTDIPDVAEKDRFESRYSRKISENPKYKEE